MYNSIHDYLKIIFEKNKNYMSEDGSILVSKIIEDAREYDELLLTFLLSDKRCKDRFFKKVNDITIFLFEDFKICLNDARFLGNSYTKFLNKIGLIEDKSLKMISNLEHIVLNYPYKDCTLDGGMTKEETERKKFKETMINNILFKEDVSKLLSPKTFKNFKKISLEKGKAEENKIDKINGDENFLINGNNLAALCSLKKKFAGQIKLIYIDPPYNTGNDTFSYNDKFNHSAWLVFMKDRLKIARDLLRDDGVIFVQCDDNEQAYLKVLMDEIFGNECFINTIVVTMSNMSGAKVRHAYTGKRFPKIKEYILLYAKSKSMYKLSIPQDKKEDWDKEYNYIIPEITKDEYAKLMNYMSNGNIDKANEIVNKCSLITLNEYSKNNGMKDEVDLEFKFNNMWRIVATKPNESVLNICKEKNINKLKYPMTCIESSRGHISIVKTDFNMETPTARVVVLFAEDKSNIFFSDLWSDITTTGGIAQEGNVSLTNGKKPEKLIHRIISTATKENDIVLDFFAGSGTTLAVAHKMNRRYIGVEQIEGHINICIERLKKVIEGEQGGISKTVEWQGGGDFVYMEIATYNFDWIKQIENVQDNKEFKELYENMKTNSIINHRLYIDYFENKNITEEKDFLLLDLEEKKSVVKEILEKNMFYVPFSERKDETFKISGEDIKLSEYFYKN